MPDCQIWEQDAWSSNLPTPTTRPKPDALDSVQGRRLSSSLGRRFWKVKGRRGPPPAVEAALPILGGRVKRAKDVDKGPWSSNNVNAVDIIAMKQLVPGVRNAVRAVIVRDDRLLLLHNRGDDGEDRFALPGGAQDLGETLAEALQRECLEEIGAAVTIGPLLHVADYFKPRQSEPSWVRHQVEFLFSCELPADYQPMMGHHPDKRQIGVVWKPLRDLTTLTLSPTSLARLLVGSTQRSAPLYLGAIE
jgi:8-oxo-dGTP diphosphatase